MIRVEHAGAVRHLILDRPQQRNGLDLEMIHALAAAIAECRTASECRCVVIEGAGDHFCSGRELAPGRARDLPAVLEYDQAYAAIFEQLHALTKPSVAVVRGFAVAGGFTLAMGCDFVLAESAARFGAVEMKNGFPAALNTVVLSRLVGARQALELLLFGEIVTARDLHAMGLVNRVADSAAELSAVAREFTDKLARLDPAAVSLTIETRRAAANMPFADALTMGKQLNALLLASGRIDEASRAFAARRRK